MAFPTGWTKRVQITIPAAQVGTGGVTDFSVLLTEASLPVSIFADARSDGGDIRASSDQAGATQLAVDVIKWDQANSKAQLRIKVPSLSSVINNTLWIWYGNASATLLAANDPYGQYAAYNAIGHWPSGGGSDRSINQNNGTYYGGASPSLQLIGDGTPYDGIDDYCDLGTLGAFGASPGRTQMQQGMSVSVWFRTSSTEIDCLLGNGSSPRSTPGLDVTLNIDQYSNNDPGRIHFNWRQINQYGLQFSAYSTTIYDGNWHHLEIQARITDIVKILLDGVPLTVAMHRATFSEFQSWSISPGLGLGAIIDSSGVASYFFAGTIDELSLFDTPRGDAAAITEYNQTNSPVTFATAGTPENIGANIYPVPIHLLLAGVI